MLLPQFCAFVKLILRVCAKWRIYVQSIW